MSSSVDKKKKKKKTNFTGGKGAFFYPFKGKNLFPTFVFLKLVK